jgi:hypothetical protein
MPLINRSESLYYIGSFYHFKTLNIGGVISKQHVKLAIAFAEREWQQLGRD